MNRLLQRLLDREPETHDSARLVRAVVLLLVGLTVGVGAAAADIYLHRGIESGAETPFVVQTTGRELAINADLTAFPPDQLDTSAAVLQTNGYRYVRQSFSWARIERTQGTYDWTTYDRIVDVLAGRGIRVVAVIHDAPAWARSPEATGYPDAPPVNPDTYAGFVQALASHYLDKLQFLQLWDQPNRADRWGGRPADARSYLALLAPAFNAARTSNPEAKVILAELDPEGGGDLRFLRALYEAGGGPFFDIVAARIDGGSSSPYDRQVGSNRINFSRAILFREAMIDHGDRQKPVWLTHFGWDGASAAVNRQEQADFTLAAIKRARAEWPWLGLMVSWDLLPNGADPSSAGRSMLDQAGAATPAFTLLSQYAANQGTSVGTTGFIPMDSAPVTYTGNWDAQHLERVTYQTTSEIGATATLTFRGTGALAIVRYSPQAGLVHATLDGRPLPGWPEANGVSLLDLTSSRAVDFPLPLVDDVSDRVHVLTLTLAERGQLTVGGLVVSRDPPLLWPVIVLILVGVLLVVGGLRDLVYVIALRTRLLQRRTGVSLRPPLPRLPDWTPARRY